jgi:DNA invertase Pin-like site-specific DNA recombinase
MSIMKDLSIDIQDMLTQGFSPNTIARILEIPVSWVYETMSNPSEAEDVEWDFNDTQAVD